MSLSKIEKIDCNDIKGRLRNGQPVYGICVRRAEKFSLFAFGSQDCAFSNSLKYDVGDTGWFVVQKSSDGQYLKFISMNEINRKPVVLENDLCLGVISGKSFGQELCMLVAPNFPIAIDNAKEMWGDNPPPEGALCAAIAIYTGNGKRLRAKAIQIIGSTMNQPKQSPAYPETIRDDFTIPADRLRYIAQLGGIEPTTEALNKIRTQIADSYEYAVENDALIMDTRQRNVFRCNFEFLPFRAAEKNNAPIFIGLKADAQNTNKRKYHVEFSGISAFSAAKLLERDVFIPDKEKALESLAQLALPEDWSLGQGSSKQPYSVLNSYLCYMYYSAAIKPGCIYITPDKSMLIFNTSLVNYEYKPIYAICDRAIGKKKKWTLTGFCVAGQGELGKRVFMLVSPKDMPPRVQLVEQITDLLLETDHGRVEILCDAEHILVDNADRLPVKMLLNAAGEHIVEVKSIVEKIESGDPYVRNGGTRELRKFMQENRTTYLYSLGQKLQSAIEVAKIRAIIHYRTAVPIYHVAGNCTSLLLPLCLGGRNDGPTDLALVIKRISPGFYQAETILTLSMAYQDARLICRPESSWLVPDAVTPAVTTAEN